MININRNIDVPETITDVELATAMKILGELIINKIKENIRSMGLIAKIGGGAFLQGWVSDYSNGQLTIDNTQDYAVFLEFGTFGYWTQNGLDKFTDPMHPKKRDMTEQMKLNYPKGMQSFAPVRKVLYNDLVMSDLVNQAFSSI